MNRIDKILKELEYNLPNSCIELELNINGSINFLIFSCFFIQTKHYKLKEEKKFIGSLSEKEAEKYLTIKESLQ